MKKKVTYPESYLTNYALYPESCITKYTTHTENQHLFRRMESLGRVSHMPPSITAAIWVPPPRANRWFLMSTFMNQNRVAPVGD